MRTAEQEAFLTKRKQVVGKDSPYLFDLFNKIESMKDSSMIVPMWDYKESVEVLLKDGILYESSSEILTMQTSQCHQNSAIAFMDNQEEYLICTGYAYTADDKLWRQHSWLMRKDEVIETTPIDRQAYFGVTLTQKQSIKFAYSELD